MNLTAVHRWFQTKSRNFQGGKNRSCGCPEDCQSHPWTVSIETDG